jgi:hypothetical protein
MPECRNTRKKVSPASLVLPLVRRVSPASAFRHRPQSGTAGHGLIRQCPAMAPTPFWETPPKISSSCGKGQKNFLKKVMIEILKKQNFMLVSKIQTYLSDKIHLKKVITKKHAKLGLTPKMAVFL